MITVLNWLIVFKEALLRSVFLFLPAMVANAAPVIASKIIRRRHPLDMGKKLPIDGRRILGQSKSVEGFIAGVVGGLATGIVYAAILNNASWVIYGLVSGFGALSGDAINSFIKRRLGIKPGDPFIPLDQLSFLLIAYILIKGTRVDTLSGVNVGIIDLSIGIYVVMVLHPLTNLIAYYMGLKDEPL